MWHSFSSSGVFVILADKPGRISSFKISPAAGLTFQPTVFYWAYLQWGLAGSRESLGSRTEPVTHSGASTALLGLNYFPPLLRPSALAQTRSSPRRRYVNLSKFQGPVKAVVHFPQYQKADTSHQNHQSKPITLQSRSITLQSRSIQVGNRQSFPTNEAVIFRRKVKLYVEMHIWGNFKESLALIQSGSSWALPPLPLPLSSFFHFISTSHTFLPLCHWSFSLN